MTAINNSINGLRMVTENTVRASFVADWISTKFSASVASIRNTSSSMNRHGNTFQGMMTSASVTRPGAIKNIHSTAAQQTPAAKIALYNPLNRHGNTFQGMNASVPVTRPGTIKNIHPIVGSAINKTAGILENDGTLTKVAGLANSRHVNAGSYNQANEYATFSGEYNPLAECELDEHLSDSDPLLGNSLKDSPDKSSPCVEETETKNRPLNKDYYTLTYGLD
ncbi:hypothetical protein [Yersinia hibernica]|uniref:hypothetical protein n=1 Tax=Yersinia hibernica TaxID=2339259 RepID=UPI00119E36EB|nr:hypothetical protein [Yersinia hibernica]